MKRYVHGLLAAVMLFGTLSATTHTNKTFLTPRSHNMNLAMKSTTWHKQTALIDNDKFGGTIQATGFYEKSNNKTDLGQYFGVCDYNNDNSIDDHFTVAPSWSKGVHWSAPYIFHVYDAPADQLTLADKLTWRPYRESYGVRLDYHQKLDKLLKGLFFKVSMPIVHAKTSLGWSSSCCTTTCGSSCGSCDTISYCTKQEVATKNDGTIQLTGDKYSLGDYLTGNVTSTQQNALCKAKIHNGNSETGIADIDLMIGYNFLYKPTRHINVSVGLTIPTGNDPDGEYLWEAIVGNHGHWALGAGLDTAFQLWSDEDKSLDFLFACNYRYLFSSTEKRTMGYKYPDNSNYTAPASAGKKVLYGHWVLWGAKGDTKATPAANFLTKDLKVTPGSHFDAIAALAFNYQNWTFDLGYNLFAKEAEDVSLKGCGSCESSCDSTCDSSSTTGWTDSYYGIAEPTWATSTAFDPTNADHIYTSANDTIDAAHLDLDACTNPSVVTHKIYGGIGYAWNEWDYPLLLGMGGSYEFATDNDSLEAWSLWGKIGITF